MDLANDFGFDRMWAASSGWTAHKVYFDDGATSPGMGIYNLSFVRDFEILPSGRLVCAWEGLTRPSSNQRYCLQYSDDDGSTWSSIADRPALGVGDGKMGGIVERNNGEIMVFVKPLLANDAIYRIVWNPSTGWGTESVWYGVSGGILNRVRPARSRDRSAAGVGFYNGNTNVVHYVPMDSVGDPGALESLGAPPAINVNDLTLIFTEDNRPRILLYDDANGTICSKTKNGSWPSSWTGPTTIDEPPTDPDFLLPVMGVVNPRSNSWGGGSFASSGNVHALRNSGGSRTFIHRRRVSGSWSQGDVDFSTLGMGADATTYSGIHHAHVFISSEGKVYAGLVWMGNSSFSQMTLWLLKLG